MKVLLITIFVFFISSSLFANTINYIGKFQCLYQPEFSLHAFRSENTHELFVYIPIFDPNNLEKYKKKYYKLNYNQEENAFVTNWTTYMIPPKRTVDKIYLKLDENNEYPRFVSVGINEIGFNYESTLKRFQCYLRPIDL